MADIPNVPYEYQPFIKHQRKREAMKYAGSREIIKARTLTADEHNALSRIVRRYDLKTNVGGKGLYENDLRPEDRAALPKLEAVGGVRIEPDGRIVPGFIIQEGGRPVYRRAKQGEHFISKPSDLDKLTHHRSKQTAPRRLRA